MNWQGKAHFVAIAAETMRRILVDHARRHAAAKRGGGWDKVPLDGQLAESDAKDAVDVIAVDLSAINFQPIHNPVSQLIYTATGHQVSHTWINGELLYDNYQFTLLDEGRLKAIVGEWHKKIEAIS